MLKFKEYSQEFDLQLESVQLTDEEVSELNEVLDTSARIKRRQQFIRRGARVAMARKVQQRRFASPERLKLRSRQRAKNLLIRRLYQGRSRSEIPLAQRKQVDIKLGRMKNAVTRISQKLIRRVRQEDIARKTKNRNLPKFDSKSQAGF